MASLMHVALPMCGFEVFTSCKRILYDLIPLCLLLVKHVIWICIRMAESCNICIYVLYVCMYVYNYVYKVGIHEFWDTLWQAEHIQGAAGPIYKFMNMSKLFSTSHSSLKHIHECNVECAMTIKMIKIHSNFHNFLCEILLM